MKKLLLATVFALSVFGQAHAGEVSENEKGGCQMLGIATELRIENVAQWAISCPKLKAKIGSDGELCTVSTIVTRNRIRGLGDMETPPIEVRKTVLKGCLMLTKDVSADEAEALIVKFGP